MSDTPDASGTPLTFETPAAPATTTCAFCARPIAGAYYTVNGRVTCGACRGAIASQYGGGAGPGGVAIAVLLGSAAGLAGAVVWWAIRHYASLEVGLIAIAIGHVVGLAVRRGSGGRGGRGYQVLAVVLTYFWITANYAPDILQAILDRGEDRGQQVGTATSSPGAASAPGAGTEAPAATPPAFTDLVLAFVVLFGFAMASPFLQGVGNILGILIISFGLWQAWKLNTPAVLAVDGPFSLQASRAAPADA